MNIILSDKEKCFINLVCILFHILNTLVFSSIELFQYKSLITHTRTRTHICCFGLSRKDNNIKSL